MDKQHNDGVDYYSDTTSDELEARFDATKNVPSFPSLGERKKESTVLSFLMVAHSTGRLFGFNTDGVEAALTHFSAEPVNRSWTEFARAYVQADGLDVLAEQGYLRREMDGEVPVYFPTEKLLVETHVPRLVGTSE